MLRRLLRSLGERLALTLTSAIWAAGERALGTLHIHPQPHPRSHPRCHHHRRTIGAGSGGDFQGWDLNAAGPRSLAAAPFP